MNELGRWALIAVMTGLAACSKQEATDPADSTASVGETTDEGAVVTQHPAEMTAEERDRAERQGKLDYATMEDGYLNDPQGQWAVTATASTTFGENSDSISDSSKAENMVGSVDGETWTNDQQNVGFDWVEVAFTRPVNATELRVVFADDDGVEAVSKLELQKEDGSWDTVWSGLSDVKDDARGPRTWFVRKFDKTSYKAKAAKVTIANNVQNTYKVIDAVQLVGE